MMNLPRIVEAPSPHSRGKQRIETNQLGNVLHVHTLRIRNACVVIAASGNTNSTTGTFTFRADNLLGIATPPSGKFNRG